jgi:23S rRNA (uracil1939-C5)-methyltransferase
MQINDQLTVTIEKLIYGGEGLARVAQTTIFVAGAAIGDQLLVRLIEQQKNFWRAAIVTILQPSPDRRVAPCPYNSTCGGCQWQHLTYSAQLTAKALILQDSLRRLGHIDWPLVPVTHAAEFGYRNRAQLKLAALPRQVGFYQPHSHTICDVAECLLLTPALNRALTTIRNADWEFPTTAYSNLDIASGNSQASDLVAAGRKIGPFSPTTIEQTIDDITYRYQPGIFFQVNQLLLPQLVQAVVGSNQQAGVESNPSNPSNHSDQQQAHQHGQSDHLAVDLYAGVGLFSLPLARRYRRVLAAEVNKPAVDWAHINMRRNKITNIDFQALSTERWLATIGQTLQRQATTIDLLVLDPPRAGVARSALTQIAALQPRQIVYVSCDPTTLARDLRLLIDHGFKLSQLQAFDLFPQTYHVETVATLTRN